MNNERNFTISMVVATVARDREVGRLLDSLAQQSEQPDEIIVVDQNRDDRLAPLMGAYGQRLNIRRLHVPELTGSSPARNLGWRNCHGDCVLFPDDDCWYPHDFIEKIARIMIETGADIVSGRLADERGKNVNGNFQGRASWIDQKNVWSTQIESVLMIRRTPLEFLGGFDPDIGVGSRYGACEAQDLSLRALNHGYRQYYHPSLIAHHPPFQRRSMPAEALNRRARRYGFGMGHVLRKHGYPRRSGALWVLKSLIRTLLSGARLDFREAGMYWNMAIGRAKGYWERAR